MAKNQVSTAASAVVGRASVNEFKTMMSVKKLLIMRGDISGKLCVQNDEHTTIATVAKGYDSDLPSAFVQVRGDDSKLFWCLCNTKPTQTYTLEHTL